jgi:hypothetical protein
MATPFVFHPSVVFDNRPCGGRCPIIGAARRIPPTDSALSGAAAVKRLVGARL